MILNLFIFREVFGIEKKRIIPDDFDKKAELQRQRTAKRARHVLLNSSENEQGANGAGSNLQRPTDVESTELEMTSNPVL